MLWLNSLTIFFGETISSDLLTISVLFTLDCNFLLIWVKFQMFWHMRANSKYNGLQCAQQLIAYGLLIKTESILT